MKDWDKIGITDFLLNNSGMSIISLSDTKAILQGTYHLCAHHKKRGDVDFDYGLRIEIPAKFPNEIPIVREISNIIPRDDDHHVNRDKKNYTDSLCLGSRIKILQKISENPTIIGFIEKCVVPFLYSITKNEFVFGELKHYYNGIIEDYEDIFDVSGSNKVIRILLCLSKKKRISNKYPCPCGCGKRLGKCILHNKINHIRRLASKKSFKEEYYQILNEKYLAERKYLMKKA